MAIYDRWGSKLDLIGAVEIDPGLWALHTRLADRPTAEVQLAESSYLKADGAWLEICDACTTLAASTFPDIIAAIWRDLYAMPRRVMRAYVFFAATGYREIEMCVFDSKQKALAHRDAWIKETFADEPLPDDLDDMD